MEKNERTRIEARLAELVVRATEALEAIKAEFTRRLAEESDLAYVIKWHTEKLVKAEQWARLAGEAHLIISPAFETGDWRKAKEDLERFRAAKVEELMRDCDTHNSSCAVTRAVEAYQNKTTADFLRKDFASMTSLLAFSHYVEELAEEE